MSVNHNYLSLDWNKVPYINDQGNMDFLFDLMEEDAMPDWIGSVPFGDQADDYLFSSWFGFMSFKDWFSATQRTMNPELVAKITSLYQDVGLLMNDKYAFVPIKKDIEFQNDWLLGAIPPADVKRLLVLSQEIDDGLVVTEFQKALTHKPLDLLANGEAFHNWLLALREGLSGVTAKNFGILLGAV